MSREFVLLPVRLQHKYSRSVLKTSAGLQRETMGGLRSTWVIVGLSLPNDLKSSCLRNIVRRRKCSGKQKMSNLLNFSIMKDDARLMRVHPGAVFMLI